MYKLCKIHAKLPYSYCSVVGNSETCHLVFADPHVFWVHYKMPKMDTNVS
jgi:hypothetical protein